MPDINDIEPFDKFMALLTGPNGGGKSIAIASWMERGSVYFFDFDGRMAPVASYYKARGLKSGQLTYDTYGPMNIYAALQKMDSFLDRCPHAAVAIDSFTAVTVSAVMYSLRQRGAKGGNFIPSTSKGSMVIPDWDEYKGETVYVTMLLDMCKSLAEKGVAVFWTAHPITSTKIEPAKGEGGKESYGKQTRYAAYGNKTDSLIPIYFNEIYHLTTEYDYKSGNNRRVCFTQPYGEDIQAKTAFKLPVKFDWTGNDITDPNFYSVLSNLIRQGQALLINKGDENEVEKKSDF